jgi:hypothetical protein
LFVEHRAQSQNEEQQEKPVVQVDEDGNCDLPAEVTEDIGDSTLL